MGEDDHGRAESETPAQPPPPTADPHVQLAFRLGWHMAELYGSKLPAKRLDQPKARATLPGVSALGDHERAEVVLHEIRAELHRLGEACRRPRSSSARRRRSRIASAPRTGRLTTFGSSSSSCTSRSCAT